MSQKTEKQMRYLSQAIQLEEAVNPHIIRGTMLMVSLAVFLFLAWAGVTNINEVARASGEVVPQGYQQVVQHLEGGIVTEIKANEGDLVEKDQVLLRLDSASMQSDLNRAKAKQIDLEMQEERLRAYIAGRNPDFSKFKNQAPVGDQEEFFTSMRSAREKERQIIKDQILQKKQAINTLQAELQTTKNNYAIVKDLYDRRADLNRQGYASTMTLLENERQLNEVSGRIRTIQHQMASSSNEIREYQTRLASLAAHHLDQSNEKLDQILAEKAQNNEVIQTLEERMIRVDVRAPVRGIIKGLTINTVGAIAQPGQTLMEIVPLGKQLEVAVKIPPQYIGQLKNGQNVHVKLSTFDFSRYGSIPGTLQKISASTFSGEGGERYYKGTVILSRNYVGENHHDLVLPGMTVMADIITGDKTILEYLLKPIQRAMKTAFTER